MVESDEASHPNEGWPTPAVRVTDAASVPRIGVVLVNWNGWVDTLECLESLLRSTIPLAIVVVDNASTNGSAERIVEWALGDRVAEAGSATLAALSSPPHPKPVSFQRLSAVESVDGGDVATVVTLIDSGGNLGFAGGNNVGLRYLLRVPSIDRLWLLNNDTVVEPGAAQALVARMDATHRIGMCGTVVRYYHRPDTVQALGGSRFNPATGQARHIGNGTPATAPYDPGRVAREMDFVLGASLAVSRRFLETVGPMAEDYFLYYEEADWAWRNKGRFVTAFAHGAVVYHKEGTTIGSTNVPGKRSALSDHYMLRSRLKFVRRHQPYLLPWHWLLGLGQIGVRFARSQPNNALAMTRALLGQRYNPETRG